MTAITKKIDIHSGHSVGSDGLKIALNYSHLIQQSVFTAMHKTIGNRSVNVQTLCRPYVDISISVGSNMGLIPSLMDRSERKGVVTAAVRNGEVLLRLFLFR